MSNALSTSLFEREKASTDPSYIFYEGNEVSRNLMWLRRISPLFLFLFILPFIFAYLFFTVSGSAQIFKLGLLLFLELSTWIIDSWIKESFHRETVIWIWLIEIPILSLIFFSLYVSF